MLWYLHDTKAEAEDAATRRSECAIANGREPGYSCGGITAAENRRSGLQYCVKYCNLPIDCADAFTRAFVSFAAGGQRSALLLPPILLFHFEHLSRYGATLVIRASAASRFIKMVAGLRTQDVRRSAKPERGNVVAGDRDVHLELHGTARKSKTSKGAPTPWWAGPEPAEDRE